MTDTHTITELLSDEQASQDYPLIRQWAGELEPRPWKHSPTPRQRKHCQKCGALRVGRDEDCWRTRGNHTPDCPIPDLATGSMPDIAERLVKTVKEKGRLLQLFYAIGDYSHIPAFEALARWWEMPSVERSACCLRALRNE